MPLTSSLLDITIHVEASSLLLSWLIVLLFCNFATKFMFFLVGCNTFKSVKLFSLGLDALPILFSFIFKGCDGVSFDEERLFALNRTRFIGCFGEVRCDLPLVG